VVGYEWDTAHSTWGIGAAIDRDCKSYGLPVIGVFWKRKDKKGESNKKTKMENKKNKIETLNHKNVRVDNKKCKKRQRPPKINQKLI